jgi:hypothetical protein
MSRSPGVILLGLLALAVAGCKLDPDSGFVEIKRKITLQRGDVLLVNKTAVMDFAARESAVIKQPAGNTTLALKRGERIEKLCEFSVGKNRLTTVTLVYTNALVRCSTQS